MDDIYYDEHDFELLPIFGKKHQNNYEHIIKQAKSCYSEQIVSEVQYHDVGHMEEWNRSTLVLAAGGHGKSHYY